MDKQFDEWEFSPFGISVFYMSWDTFPNILTYLLHGAESFLRS